MKCIIFEIRETKKANNKTQKYNSMQVNVIKDFFKN